MKMIELIKKPMYLLQGEVLVEGDAPLTVETANEKLKAAGKAPLQADSLSWEKAHQGTMAYGIMMNHNTSGSDKELKMKFDELTSHDITYVGIIQTAMASGMKEFPVPYVLTNCHNSLNAVGGTINEDDHFFGLSSAKKFGGIYVPAHQAVIHTYMREMYAGVGKMIMGSDSHTRYGALGTMAVGEGGPEIAKQLLKKTYDMSYPDVVGIYLEGAPVHGVGPQDVALAMIGAVFSNGFVKNAVMEFVGPGVSSMSIDFRNGIDVMTTETTCWTSIWRTDDKVKSFLTVHGRANDYKELNPGEVAGYDRIVRIDLSKIKPMIALPFHPSNAYTIEDVNANTLEILHHIEAEGKKALENPNIDFRLTDKLDNGRLRVNQGVIAGCSGGTFENIVSASRILDGQTIGDDYFTLSVYPGSQPVNLALLHEGAMEKLTLAGATMRTAFCGPCFGAGDTPANNGFSIRHTTRNFPNREGSKPGDGQISSVALMDSRSIAATARNNGFLTPATEIAYDDSEPKYEFARTVYDNRVYQGFGKANSEEEVIFGPNIAPWPEMQPLGEDILLRIATVILDPVTTTDELMPSGETSSLRSNPIKLSNFTLSRKDPSYLARTQEMKALEDKRVALNKEGKSMDELQDKLSFIGGSGDELNQKIAQTQIGTVVFARRPGDGSAREQAASGQKVLGGQANIAVQYATKRYRSNLLNWGMLPFTMDESHIDAIELNDYLYIPGIKSLVESGAEVIEGFLINESGKKEPITLKLEDLNQEERDVILAGSLINYYGKA